MVAHNANIVFADCARRADDRTATGAADVGVQHTRKVHERVTSAHEPAATLHFRRACKSGGRKPPKGRSKRRPPACVIGSRP